MNLHTALVGALLVVVAQHSEMPQGMSHEEHLKQMEKDAELKKRGALAMGFDQDAATHHFRLTSSGGSIEVTINNDDGATLSEVRTHLKAIAEAFAHGDFDKPVETHAEVPAGVTVMKRYANVISYRYDDLPRGGVVRIRTADARARRGVHDFLRYQIIEHQTGDPLTLGR
jgi:hypothetical protein